MADEKVTPIRPDVKIMKYKPRRFTDLMVAAYRAGHAAAEWECRKPAKPPRNGREIRKRKFEAILDGIVPGIGGIPAVFYDCEISARVPPGSIRSRLGRRDERP